MELVQLRRHLVLGIQGWIQSNNNITLMKNSSSKKYAPRIRIFQGDILWVIRPMSWEALNSRL